MPTRPRPQRPSTVDSGPAPVWPQTFREQWAQLLTTTHTPREWAVITAAIHTADARRRDALGEAMVRGSEEWCRLAVIALESPHSAATHEGVPTALGERCRPDPDVIRAWLCAPDTNSYQRAATVADGLDLIDWAHASDESAHRAMDDLLTTAQHAGVFGVTGYRIELAGFQVVDGDDLPAGHLLVLRPEFGPGLASTLVPPGELTPATGNRMDGAITVLATIATLVNSTVDSHDAADRAGIGRHDPTPAQAPERTRAFAAPPHANAPDTTPPSTPPDPPSARNPRRR